MKDKDYTFLYLFFVTTILAIMFGQCNRNVDRPNPGEVGYRELVSETEDCRIYRDCKYKLISVTYDTVAKRKPSTIETPSTKIRDTQDRVDLNDIFDPNHESDVDWNYAELDEENCRYLDSIGVYWDSHSGCYRKHK